MKQSLDFPQTYIISTKYNTQQQMKQSLDFPQTNIISTKYKTQQQIKQPLFVFCSDDICLWKTQELFRLFLSFVFCSDDICLWETQGVV
jgi:hypothetical protein